MCILVHFSGEECMCHIWVLQRDRVGIKYLMECIQCVFGNLAPIYVNNYYNVSTHISI